MSNDGLKRTNAAASQAPFDNCITSKWQRRRTGERSEPITRPNVSNVTDPQDPPLFPTDRAEQPSGATFTQPNMEWNDLLDGNAYAAINDNLRALIAGMQNPYSLREWSQLDPLDRSFFITFRQSAAVGLARMAGAYLDEDHPLLPDVVNAARDLFEHGILRNSRADRMLAAEIIVNASPFLPSGFRPAYDAASVLRKFIEAQANRHGDSEEAMLPETIFSIVARTKPRPPMITTKLIRMMKEKALQRAEKRVAAGANETLACMQAYEGLIPRFARGHTEVMAGMLMCSTLIEGTSNNELIGKAYELQGQLADLQLSPSAPAFHTPKIRPM